jgi:hypothetical protein
MDSASPLLEGGIRLDDSPQEDIDNFSPLTVPTSKVRHVIDIELLTKSSG